MLRRRPLPLRARPPPRTGEMQGALARARLQSLLRPRHKKRAEAQKRSESFLLTGLGKRRGRRHAGTSPLRRWSRGSGTPEGPGVWVPRPQGGGTEAARGGVPAPRRPRRRPPSAERPLGRVVHGRRGVGGPVGVPAELGEMAGPGTGRGSAVRV